MPRRNTSKFSEWYFYVHCLKGLIGMDIVYSVYNSLPRWAKKLYIYFSTVPNDVEIENYWFYNISNLAYILIAFLHISWIVVFYLMGQMTMMYIQFLSIACYAVAIILNRKGYHVLSMVIGITEVNLHQAVAVILLGWGTGFQNFIPLIALLPFLKYNESWITKAAIGMSSMFCYLYIDKYIKNTPPISSLGHASFNFLNISNSILCFLLVALWGIVLALSYQRAVSALIKKEQELLLSQKTVEQTEILRRLDLKERDNEIFQLRYIELRDRSIEILQQKVVIEELVTKQEEAAEAEKRQRIKIELLAA